MDRWAIRAVGNWARGAIWQLLGFDFVWGGKRLLDGELNQRFCLNTRTTLVLCFMSQVDE